MGFDQKVLYFSPYLKREIDVSSFYKFIKSVVLSGIRSRYLNKGHELYFYLDKYHCYFYMMYSANYDIYVNCMYYNGGEPLTIDAFKEIISVAYTQ